MSKAHEGLPPDSPSDVRALPARPNLEFERKHAKKLLAQLHKGDPEVVARVRAKHRASTGKSPDEFQLADAQFAIAREYGFTSWPRLVEYFESLYRQERSGAVWKQLLFSFYKPVSFRLRPRMPAKQLSIARRTGLCHALHSQH